MTYNTRTIQMEALSSPIALGRSAQIYAFENNRVLKLFWDTIPDQEIQAEFRNTCEASDLGVCSMDCHAKVIAQNRSGIVLDRIDGISLTRMPEKNPLYFFKLPNILADLHLQLHQARTEKLPDIRLVASQTLDRTPLQFLGPDQKAQTRQTIEALPEGETLLHMDFHPENVLVSDTDLVPIDWMTAARGVPAADVAATVFLLRDAELMPGISKAKETFYEIVRRYILKKYLKCYLSQSGLSMKAIDLWRLPILVLRLGLWDIDSERDRLKSEILALLSGTGELK